MNQMQYQTNGWVVVRPDGTILDWSFEYTRSTCIKELCKNSSHSWKQWYRMGFRCHKATKTIAIA